MSRCRVLIGLPLICLCGCWLFPPPPGGPAITSVAPLEGYRGTVVTIRGANFSAVRTDNHVRIGNVPAIVVTASPTKLEAIVGFGATDGPVEVRVGATTATASDSFTLRRWPAAGSGEDGPPIFYAGAGDGATGDLPSTGTLRVLVVPSYPTDRVPADLVAERAAIGAPWHTVTTFYDQASYGTLNVEVTVADWVALSGAFDDYYSADEENIAWDATDRFTAECANGAETQGQDMDNFDAMACVLWTDGVFIRAWGGWSKSNFAYADAGLGLDINIAVGHEVHLMTLGERADWGRCAHELGHSLVHAGAVLGEDVYSSDLVDPCSATAQRFELMGAHDSHPLFSGENMYQLGWYDGGKIVELEWSRDPCSLEYDLAAHRLTQDADPDRYHLIRIKVADGLYYYIEARQRPPRGDAQIFDTDIPLDGERNGGGVVVTKVITDEVNNNQEMRFITLLHDETVLTTDDVATDPERGLKITVLSNLLDVDRLVPRVRIEWAQELEPDPRGDFDLRIEPWGPDWETVDIWIDREPWGTFDYTDADGNPTGNGDRPQPMAINHFWGRVHCDGDSAADNVRLTFYSITPPGVGGNGTWTPLETVEIDSVAGDGQEERSIDWVPTVGRHTCLQVIAEHQPGEISYGNNKAQENVFDFEAPASSPPDPVKIPLAVRNPRNEPSIVLVRLVGVPAGYTVQLPHHWVYLDALGERQMEAIVVPTRDILDYQLKDPTLNLKIDGRVPRQYSDPVGKDVPASRMLPIGGLTARVTPKYRATVQMREDQKYAGNQGSIGLLGSIAPAHAAQPLLVVLRDPLNRIRAQNVTTNAAGQFSAVFDLTHAPTNDPIHGAAGPPEAPVGGEYKARAFIVNAPKVAQAESTEVIIHK